MSRNWTLHLLLALAIGFSGCARKTKEKTKTESTKTALAEQKSQSRNSSEALTKQKSKTESGNKVVTKVKPKGTNTNKAAAKTIPRNGTANGTVTKVDGSYISTKVVRPSANKPINTQYISKEFVGAIVYHPAQAFNSQLAKNMLAEFEKESGKQLVEKVLASMERQFGVDPRKCEQITFLMDGESLRKHFTISFRERSLLPLPSMIVRFNEKVDQQKILSVISRMLRSKDDKKLPDGVQPERPAKLPEKKPLFSKKHAGHTYHLVAPMAVCFVDDKTLLIAKEELLKKMLTAKNVNSPLTQQLSKLGAEHDVLLAVNLQPLATFLQKMKLNQFPPDIANTVRLALQVKTLTATASYSGDVLISVMSQMRTKESAKDFAEVIREMGMKRVLAEYHKLTSRIGSRTPGNIYEFIEQLITGLSIGHQGTDVVVTITRPNDLNNLPRLLIPAVRQAREAARRSTRKNNLMQIGIAMHNFHETYLHLPAADSNGEPKGRGRKSGLSWRVYLLPYLEQQALFRQFKLDEAWDSPHNKKLISKMPQIFSNPSSKISRESGKTSIHVFVGNNNTPFGIGTTGSRFRDITDGTSNTLMAVEAGDDKAEFWTKPGGLQFDPKENPLKLLGKLPSGEFLALFCDGRPRSIKTSITLETLRNLIQRNDGNVVKDIP